jgi:hypothetical protein
MINSQGPNEKEKCLIPHHHSQSNLSFLKLITKGILGTFSPKDQRVTYVGHFRLEKTNLSNGWTTLTIFKT